LVNRPITRLATWPMARPSGWPKCLWDSLCILDPKQTARQAKMELTWRGYGIRLKVLGEQVDEGTRRVVKQVYRHRSSERHRDLQEVPLRMRSDKTQSYQPAAV